MINQEEMSVVKDIMAGFFSKAGFEVEVETREEERGQEEILEANIKTSEAQSLIGKQGLVLADAQLLLRKIIKKKLGREIYLNMDIDGYKKNKESYLKDVAESVADEVAKTRQPKELPYSSSFDRRIVHMHLADRKDVTTESVGEGENRRLIVKPVI